MKKKALVSILLGLAITSSAFASTYNASELEMDKFNNTQKLLAQYQLEPIFGAYKRASLNAKQIVGLTMSSMLSDEEEVLTEKMALDYATQFCPSSIKLSRPMLDAGDFRESESHTPAFVINGSTIHAVVGLNDDQKTEVGMGQIQSLLGETTLIKANKDEVTIRVNFNAFTEDSDEGSMTDWNKNNIFCKYQRSK